MSHQPRFYATPNFFEMGIKYLNLSSVGQFRQYLMLWLWVTYQNFIGMDFTVIEVNCSVGGWWKMFDVVFSIYGNSAQMLWQTNSSKHQWKELPSYDESSMQ